MRQKLRIPELISDSNSGHVQVVNQKTDLSPHRADYTGLHAHSLEGTCGPFVRGGRARAQALGGGVFRPLSLSLRGVEGRAHVVREVFVGLRGEEEFHDFGVTVGRGPRERRGPILKERTEREGARRKRGRQQEHTLRG